MQNHNTQKLTGTAMIAALMILFQSLRLLIPMPFFSSTLVIGSLVNACVLIVTLRYGWKNGLLLAFLAPAIASFQGMLVSPLFILPIFVAQGLYLGTFYFFYSKRWQITFLILPSLLKAICLYLLFLILFEFILFPDAAKEVVLLMMSWPQIITGIAGVLVAIWIQKKINKEST